ncbi:MAG: complex I NDUFA9 subunit family protein [Desulfuromonas sp.]|nr:complex I NDUFA9 subunit family protein [Desulfuromonas sp.]
MRIFITGGTGFVGSHLIRYLASNNHQVRCLARSTPTFQPYRTNIEYHSGDITDKASLVASLAGCDAIIHLVGIIRAFPQRNITFERLHVEATRNIIEAAEQAGISRYLHMSANGACETADGNYLTSKWHAEQLARHSRLEWTIFRPSLIYGSGGEFTHMLSQQVRLLPIIPIIGNGQYQLSPVYITDVVTGFANALSTPSSIHNTYHCCGPDQCSYDELIDLFATALGRKKPTKLHQPLSLMRRITHYLERFPAYPVTSEQISMLTNGNVCDPRIWSHDLHITPTALEEGIKKTLTG